MDAEAEKKEEKDPVEHIEENPGKIDPFSNLKIAPIIDVVPFHPWKKIGKRNEKGSRKKIANIEIASFLTAEEKQSGAKPHFDMEPSEES